MVFFRAPSIRAPTIANLQGRCGDGPDAGLGGLDRLASAGVPVLAGATVTIVLENLKAGVSKPRDKATKAKVEI